VTPTRQGKVSVVSIPDRDDRASVRCQLVVDLSDLGWLTRDSEAEVARRFADVSDAPRNAVVNILLPRNGGSIPLHRAFAGWNSPPAGLQFVMQARNTRQGMRARADLDRALEVSFEAVELDRLDNKFHEGSRNTEGSRRRHHSVGRA
jgi:hypothetical protein